MRYSYEEKCPVLFVFITVSEVICVKSVGPSNQFTALLIFLSFYSSIFCVSLFAPTPWPPSVHFFLGFALSLSLFPHSIHLTYLTLLFFLPFSADTLHYYCCCFFLPPSLPPSYVLPACPPFLFSSLGEVNYNIPPNHFTETKKWSSKTLWGRSITAIKANKGEALEYTHTLWNTYYTPLYNQNVTFLLHKILHVY